jgi:hypothetical protein
MKIVNVILGVVGILVALAVWWANQATDEANELIKAGNAQLELGNTHLLAALEKLKAVEAASFPEQAEAVRKLASEGAELYTKSGDTFRESAAKYQAASETVHDSEMKEYFNLQQKSVAKLAQLQDLLRKYLLVYADPTINDAETLKQKINGYETQATGLSSEHGALQAAAEKYAADHKDKIAKVQ